MEFARNVLANAPREHAIDAFLKLSGKSFPRPSEVIQKAKELAGEKKKFPPLQKFLVVSYSSTNGLDYEAVREIPLDQDGRDAVRVGEPYVDQYTVGGDKVARWRAEWEAMPPEEKQKAEDAKQRFKAALGAFLGTHSIPGPKPTRISPDDEREIIKHMEDKGAA